MDENAQPAQAPPDDLRDIAAPPEVWDLSQFLLVGLGMLLLLGLVLALLAWRRRIAGRPMLPELPASPRRTALRELERLKVNLGEHSCGSVATMSSEAIRTFLHREHGALAKFVTTEELAGTRGSDLPPPPPEIEPFAHCLGELDGLRFGRANAPGFEAKTVLERAIIVLSSDSGRGTRNRPIELPEILAKSVPEPRGKS